VSRGPLLIPNVGAEEGADAPGPGRSPRLAALVALWRLLFAADAFDADPADAFDADPADALDADSADATGASRTPPAQTAPPSSAWPAELGERPAGAAFPRLDGDRERDAFAWLHTREAERAAAARGRVLVGADAAAVARVHDKAFALHAARTRGLLPAPFGEGCLVLEPEELASDALAAAGRIRDRMRGWPAWVGGRGTLKPRLGTSGRGRVALDGSADVGPGAFARLARRGGALLEPWVERVRDLSVQLWIDPDGGVVLLGTLEARNTAAGVCRGHRGTLDNRGRVTSGLPEDERVREAAVELALAAREAGYHGPLGVDAFVFRAEGGAEVLRPVVELNARFTLGLVVLGLLRRALPRVRSALPAQPEQRRRFCFRLEADAPSRGSAQDERALEIRFDGGGGASNSLLRVTLPGPERPAGTVPAPDLA